LRCYSALLLENYLTRKLMKRDSRGRFVFLSEMSAESVAVVKERLIPLTFSSSSDISFHFPRL